MPSLFYEELLLLWVILFIGLFFLAYNRFDIYLVILNLRLFFRSIFVSLNIINVEPFERKKTTLILSSIFFLSFCFLKLLSVFIVIASYDRFLFISYSLLLFWLFREDVIPFLFSSKPIQLLIYFCMRFEEMFLSSPLISRVVNSILFVGALVFYVVYVGDMLPVQLLSLIFYFYRTTTRLLLGSNLNDLEDSSKSDLNEEPLDHKVLIDENLDWSLVSLYMSKVSISAFGKPIKWKLDNIKTNSGFPLVVRRYLGNNMSAIRRHASQKVKDAAESEILRNAKRTASEDPLTHLWGAIGATGVGLGILGYKTGRAEAEKAETKATAAEARAAAAETKATVLEGQVGVLTKTVGNQERRIRRMGRIMKRLEQNSSRDKVSTVESSKEDTMAFTPKAPSSSPGVYVDPHASKGSLHSPKVVEQIDKATSKVDVSAKPPGGTANCALEEPVSGFSKLLSFLYDLF